MSEKTEKQYFSTKLHNRDFLVRVCEELDELARLHLTRMGQHWHDGHEWCGWQQATQVEISITGTDCKQFTDFSEKISSYLKNKKLI